MVEISNCQVQNGHTTASLNCKIAANKCLSSASFETRAGEKNTMADTDRLPEPDLSLVEEVRQLIKAEWDKDPEESERIYSKYHYDELTEAGAPYVCWRYLLHMDLNVKSAVQLIKTTLKWRKENKIDELQAKDFIKDIWLRAPIGLTGKTKSGHDLAYAIGRNYRKPDPIIKQMVRDYIGFLLFNWDKQHRYDLEQFVAVFDVSDTGLRNMDIDFSSWLVSIRDFVPARVKALYVVGIPFIVRPIIRLIISWLPERYRRITYCGTFDELVTANIDKDNLPSEVGGLADETWRLAPPDSTWADEIEMEDCEKVYAKICEACSFNTKQEKLDQLYKMQRDFEAKKL